MTKHVHAQTLIQAFESWVPKSLAFEGDKIGLQIGTLNKPIKKVMVTLDVLENVVDEAIEKEVDLIFSHHAVIFRPLKNMRTDEGQSKIIAKCIKHDIAVYNAHTNLDNVDGGMNDWLAEALELQDTEILIPKSTERLFKLAVYTPVSHEQSVREALGNAGAGAIGHYSHCSFNTPGKGIFKPEEGTQPYIGQTGKLETVEEIKIETVVPESLLNKVKRAMLKAHPYEEVAYDLFALENKGKAHGLGRIGYLQEPTTLKAFAAVVKSVFDLEGVRVVGDLNRKIEKVAILGGDGNSFYKQAKLKGADVFVTGDIYYHTGHDAILEDLPLIDAGHYIEKVMKEGVGRFFKQFLSEHRYDTEVVVSKVNTNPFTFL
ncbi:dinuclear metal center YbgI/SA1388 family protein [Pullulanibacillus pueri]|uniref:GTP cyclohydrolase 1 type 2 homolog n=1 Tax=Pullulanibacillus pueri TaxID=1437324 RepID=A0A8J3EMK7_9BACL|nr:Nif3-like dinuclear metal center hexameric protein [Pullulanibacillus pueri]MBM7683029.1 dinuclear metal center YbgI/SA1388 family protein [Pullulanibacillus pueri]GGH85019.1 GTP cyclohydrolase 1 type 2 [Pullulanibacillus pueri]